MDSTHPFARKEWYEVKAPAMFEKRTCGLTPVTKTTGMSIRANLTLYRDR